ncbi:MAG: RsmD family RNA methyltransferase [Candidatus Bostrichicola ureolyticus]|nr:MAG: RsmD family RNA methyltransferase [Candidatus Bostrichicola ureolyticus]
MRIISGKLKGKIFSIPKNLSKIRPTTDRAKESLFNILNNKIIFNNKLVLDLFCGIGSISYEFVSRGISKIYSLDINAMCIQYIRKKSIDFNIQNKILALKYNVFFFLKKNRNLNSDIIFADPPYGMEDKYFLLLINLCFNNELIKKNGILIIEHPVNKQIFCDNKNYINTKKYGRICFSFFTKKN